MKTKTRKKQIDEYDFTQQYSNYERTASVTFINGEFKGCAFIVETSGKSYTYADWMFLKEIAEKIEELQNIYNK